MGKKISSSDFRYNTGKTRVPWAAVGENIIPGDIMDIVKFLVPKAGQSSKEYKTGTDKIQKEVEKLCSAGSMATKLSLGTKVKELEENVKKYLKCKHAVFVTNATAGFEIANKFAGVKPGDEVIVPAITFIATMSYPLAIGAKVVLADIDSSTLNMDPEDVSRKITRKTKLIIPVHLGGYPADMDPIMALAKKRNITVLEDAAHAFGGEYKGRKIGTIGHFGAFSFHEVKNITSMGEGGILNTNLKCGEEFPKARFVGFDIAHPIKNWLYDVTALRWKGDCFAPGNSSSTEIQAVGLIAQLKRLEKIIEKRRKAAEYLNSIFKNVRGLLIPKLDSAEIKSTHHLYLLKIDPSVLKGDIQMLKQKLTKKGITQIQHFAPLYKFSIMKQLGYDTGKIAKSCPNAEEAFSRTFTHLPLYDFDKSQLDYLADAVIKSVKEM
ncbi:MAG: hypothetical protein A2452_01045 [Candidatus Firestonebacteria bacterium RIFOXYC2_FULL_39_67]|nr:MAG: hypothetical protein A2536_11110 [Candidatus Firestonebacteria bacterium RIFOXYD2_FULL_39_29]OGF52208.1 MAG: hypothetical protein A2497_02080 [Candidatus Firestonebacteria bacterium RifOxyC12_full_39_7]OGF54066.1 MAG: hypothetical protein A2452_01045 [Candidatus Firestonebacteria bacterium RIFOXYC2_FULL_39_67]